MAMPVYDCVSQAPVCPKPTDGYVQIALDRGDIRVDPATGAVTDRDGNRLERHVGNGRGQVRVQRYPREVWADAHRIVWIAVNGPIPRGYGVRHRNKRKWDNRPVNLYVSRRRGFVTYPESGAA